MPSPPPPVCTGTATGAASFALLTCLRQNPRQNYTEVRRYTHSPARSVPVPIVSPLIHLFYPPIDPTQLLRNMRSVLAGKYTQVPQLTTAHPIDLNVAFTM